jgi:predicted lysophospholipase L1 biosynthesis ABC-type transport system permease subunit
MVLTWFIGVHGLNVGFSIASLLRSGSLPDLTTAALHTGTLGDVAEYATLQQLRSLLSHPHIAFPLAVAQMLLSGLLVVASGLAMGGRRGARSLALQALGANALLVVATFALTPFQRAAYIEGVLHAVESVTLPDPQREMLTTPAMLQWVLRIRLVMFDLVVLGLGALALTRARTKTFFEAVARATEGPEEP